MKRIILTITGILAVAMLISQENDYVWHFGYGDNENNPYDSIAGKSVIDFNDSLSRPLIYYNGESHIDYFGVNATIADERGNYLFTYNGSYIEDASNNVMMNGSMLSESGNETGDFPSQSGLILPLPESDHEYILFHSSWKYFDTVIAIAGNKLHYSVIDMEKNNGKGAVISKRNLLIQDTLATGKITSTRHANGRDWWILIPSYNDDEYFRVLLTPKGPKMMPLKSTGVVQTDGLGHSCFSPDGNFYASFSSISTRVGSFLYIYNFNREIGLLSNPRKIQMDIDSGRTGSIAISPNSNILYLFLMTEIFQFDLSADSILLTKNLVAEVDNYLHPVPGTNVKIPHNFYMSQLGPDGKIYVCPYNINRVLTTVEYPDRWGDSCFVNQHSVYIPTFNTSMPNFPNYRLGPIDGSPSDTLGIDNIPLSRFRIDQDTSNYLKFQFVELADYEPDEWIWSFGDSSISFAKKPSHTYSEPGLYKVCLTVRNENGTDVNCKKINIATTSTNEQNPDLQISVYPNPCTSFLNIQFVNYYPGQAHLFLYDAQGRMVKVQKLHHGQNTIPVYRLPTGMYFYRINDKGVLLKNGKVFKE